MKLNRLTFTDGDKAAALAAFLRVSFVSIQHWSDGSFTHDDYPNQDFILTKYRKCKYYNHLGQYGQYHVWTNSPFKRRA